MSSLIAGVDEAGRGPLAGPVVAAAVILGDAEIEGLRDSKALSPRRRVVLAEVIRATVRAWSVAQADVDEIEGLSIRNATLLAMRRAVEGLALAPGLVLVDGRDKIPGLACHQEAVVRGDTIHAQIAAASILAKTHRDALMVEAAGAYPAYGFDAHKGYGTRRHLEALHQHGPCPIHRRNYAPVRAEIAMRRMFGDHAFDDAPECPGPSDP
jgi:ribonuclease HII